MIGATPHWQAGSGAAADRAGLRVGHSDRTASDWHAWSLSITVTRTPGPGPGRTDLSPGCSAFKLISNFHVMVFPAGPGSTRGHSGCDSDRAHEIGRVIATLAGRGLSSETLQTIFVTVCSGPGVGRRRERSPGAQSVGTR
jgi:hypothetical protein